MGDHVFQGIRDFYCILRLYFIAQTSVDSVDDLMKKHEEFESTSLAHDEKIRLLSEHANRLIQAGHYDTVGCVAAYFSMYHNDCCSTLQPVELHS